MTQIFANLHRRYLNQGAAAPLKKLGYIMSGREFSKSVGAMRYLLWFSRDQSMDGDFIWELGDACVLVEGMQEALWPSDPKVGPAEFPAPVQIDVWQPYPHDLPEDYRQLFADAPEADLIAKAELLRRAIAEYTVPWLEQFSTPRALGDYLADPAPGIGLIRLSYSDIPQDRMNLIHAAGCYVLSGEPEKALGLVELALKTKAAPSTKEVFWPKMKIIRDHIERLVREGAAPPSATPQ